ncbi:MAG TPA: 50S ribosomal protein L22 [Candidatus Eisenbacteria bacterium]|nr:50S ribosomal protein L22 [Candidatus Eisenbacteria bacterium]
MTQAQARTTGVRISTRKVRLVADAIRNMSVTKALQLLSTTPKHGASILLKTVKSAVANAVQKGADEASLQIVGIEVDGGPTLRRMHVGSRSHMRAYTKRSTHVRIIVSDMKTEEKKSSDAKALDDKKGETK